MKYKMFTWADTKLYLIVIGLSVVIIAFFQPIVAFIMGIILAYLVYYNSKKIEDKNKELARGINKQMMG